MTGCQTTAAHRGKNEPSPASCWAAALQRVAALQSDPACTLPARLDGLARAHAENIACADEHGQFTYAGLLGRRNQYANWAIAHGADHGSVVGLMLHNSIEYPALWLGLGLVGAVAALIPPALAGGALRHAVAASGATVLVAEASLVPQLRAAGVFLPVWCIGAAAHGAEAGHLDAAGYPEVAPGPEIRGRVSLADVALLIFTSGTTGLPKAARITHARILEWSGWFAGMMAATRDDRLYNCLPLHHSTGGVVGVGAMLVSGGSVIIRERFSARRFWPDVAASGCTIFLYIGELCRYLLAAPEDKAMAGHRLRLCCGNGLRENVWRRFVARFQIPRILEFYASTEGNVSLYNAEGRPGAIGRLPPLLAQRPNVLLLACDPATGELRRDAGRVRVADVDEAGEAVGRIGNGASRFDGYTDPAATERKILRDVMAPGDAWFRTGDLMRRDRDGYFYFLDRLGDTFRWKGENVSTAEVAEAIGACPGVIGVAVYGVAVPGEEGRVGMAAITVSASFDLAALEAVLARELPPHARPLFLRLCRNLDSTTTFKPVKLRLAAEGFTSNPDHDPVYRFDARAGAYRPLAPAAACAS